MRVLRRLVWTALIATLLGGAGVLLWAGGRSDGPVDLGAPPGPATARKLAALRDSFPACQALLSRSGVAFEVAPARRDGPACGYADGIGFQPGGSRAVAFAPARLRVSCPVAAALAGWEWNAVQPAALRHFGQPVAAIEHLGSYNCRRMYGRTTGNWSEHATANAVDIAGFRLEDGRRIGVLQDWAGDGPAARFLRDVRDGACALFGTVLSPDYNAAHRDHLHLDQARRGAGWGWRACR
jgi:hypothetical protein